MNVFEATSLPKNCHHCSRPWYKNISSQLGNHGNPRCIHLYWKLFDFINERFTESIKIWHVFYYSNRRRDNRRRDNWKRENWKRDNWKNEENFDYNTIKIVENDTNVKIDTNSDSEENTEFSGSGESEGSAEILLLTDDEDLNSSMLNLPGESPDFSGSRETVI